MVSADKKSTIYIGFFLSEITKVFSLFSTVVVFRMAKVTGFSIRNEALVTGSTL
jgi:hypothetical protein